MSYLSRNSYIGGQTVDNWLLSYQCISASGPASYSCRCWAETSQKSWRLLSQCRTTPGGTGSEYLSTDADVDTRLN